MLGRCWRPTQKRDELDIVCTNSTVARDRCGPAATYPACPSTPPLLCWCRSFPAVSATVALSRTFLHVPDSWALTRPGLGTTKEAISAASVLATPLPQSARSTRCCPPLRNIEAPCHGAWMCGLVGSRGTALVRRLALPGIYVRPWPETRQPPHQCPLFRMGELSQLAGFCLVAASFPRASCHAIPRTIEARRYFRLT